MDTLLLIGVGLLGAVFGSFAGAQVWRLRARQLMEDKQAGEKVDSKEFKRLGPLRQKNLRNDRSQCLSCSSRLKWYDLLPIVSWLSTWGRCRYCKQPIGWTEIILEIGLSSLFALSVLFWPTELAAPLAYVQLGLWLGALVCLAVLFVYDARWFLLPDQANLTFIVLGALFALIGLWQSSDIGSSIASLVGSTAILGGLYLLLYAVSRGTWVGFGDVKLGVGMGLFLMDWRLAFIALFSANLVGTVLVLPSVIKHTLRRDSKVPFGPLLIIGFLIAWFFGVYVADWYQSLLF